MAQKRLMIVTGVLKDYVEDISSYIDELDDASSSPKLLDLTTKLISAESGDDNKEQIFRAIAERSVVLSKTPKKEDFEPAYNLVLHILSFSSKLTELVPIVLSNLKEIPAFGPVPTLMVLSNLFNILPDSSPLRFDVFCQIIDVAEQSNSLYQIDLKPVPKWLAEWECTEQQKVALFEKLYASYNDKKQVTAILAESLKRQQKKQDDTTLAAYLLKSTISDAFTYDFDEILEIPAVIATREGSNASLYKQAVDINEGSFASVSGEVPVKKAKLRALASFASSYVSKTNAPADPIPYSAIAQHLAVDSSSVEHWLIDAIKAGVVEGRMSQITESFTVHRAQPVGSFGEQDWEVVQAKLDQWKSSLREVLDVVQNAKDNARVLGKA